MATQTVVIKAGQPQQLAQFPSSMESQLKNLGLQVKLESGKYYLLSDYVVCNEGQGLTPEQSKMIVSSLNNLILRNILEYKWMNLRYMYYLTLRRMESTKKSPRTFKKQASLNMRMKWKFK